MNPYSTLSADHFWANQVSSVHPAAINYEPSPKWRFNIETDRFATAGSCFAQHFSRHIVARGGAFVEVETRHPLIPKESDAGYGVFSARYGNIYTCRQLRDLVEQALRQRSIVEDYFEDQRGRWIDLSRLRAVPDGFSCYEACHIDRLYHLERVAQLFKDATVFVFTLGLTESWINAHAKFCYPICPGVLEGAFDPQRHVFQNLSFPECFDDLSAAIQLIHRHNPNLRILLTVSPVMLVATYEPRGALQSSIASKSVLRAVADHCVRMFDYVDYFPSYEIVTGPQAGGRFYKIDSREVGSDGVDQVMDIFFRSRFDKVPTAAPRPQTPIIGADADDKNDTEDRYAAECDEILLGKK